MQVQMLALIIKKKSNKIKSCVFSINIFSKSTPLSFYKNQQLIEDNYWSMQQTDVCISNTTLQGMKPILMMEISVVFCLF